MSTTFAAHPFGDPQTIEISRDAAGPEVVHLTWKAGAADDLTLLGIHLDVLPEDRLMLDGAIRYDDADAELVSGSEEVAAYLLDHIQVADPDPATVDTTECSGAVVSAGDLVTEGVELAFTCPGPLDQARVTVTTLTDLHEAYRTLATGPEGQHQVYESGNDTQVWTLGPAGSTTTGSAAGPDPEDSLGAGADAALQMGGVLGAVLLAAAVATLAVRRRRQRFTPHPESPTP